MRHVTDQTPDEQAITRVLHALAAEQHERLCNCRDYPDSCSSKSVYDQPTMVANLTYAEPALEEAIRQGWTPPPPAGSDAPTTVTVIAQHHVETGPYTPGWSWSCANRACGVVRNGFASHGEAFADPERVNHACPSDAPNPARTWIEGDPEPDETVQLLHESGDTDLPWLHRVTRKWVWSKRADYVDAMTYAKDWEDAVSLASGPLSEVPAPTGTEHR